jgi:hypothetical protein
MRTRGGAAAVRFLASFWRLDSNQLARNGGAGLTSVAAAAAVRFLASFWRLDSNQLARNGGAGR